jgi:hypothetical protein
MLDLWLRFEEQIQQVLVIHRAEIDQFTLDNLILTSEERTTLKEVKEFFSIFRKPTVQAQADEYPTLYPMNWQPAAHASRGIYRGGDHQRQYLRIVE